MLIINFIGCGRVGKTLAKLINQHKLAKIGGILNSTSKSSEEAVKFIGAGESFAELRDLPPADIYFITSNDDKIADLCNKLIVEATINKNAIFLHCSGALSSEILQKAQINGYHTVSVHPIKSFANVEIAIANFSGTYCAYEGDAIVLPIIEKLFSGIGGILFPIQKDQKNIYHIAGVIANNYLVGLHHTAYSCYKQAGVNPEVAYKITSKLMQDALKNLENSEHQHALTGPIQRGDISVVEKHLIALQNATLLRDVYIALGEATLAVTKHSDEVREQLLKVLQK